jgi:diguanylate cyclase (GGDEF)-like protein/PAS domain S-box-containing protein
MLLYKTSNPKYHFTNTKYRLKTVIFICLVLISSIPVIFLGMWMQQNSLQKEIDTVEEKHLIIAQNLSSALERYAIDTIAIFDFLSSNYSPPNRAAHTKALLKTVHISQVCVVEKKVLVTDLLYGSNCLFNLTSKQTQSLIKLARSNAKKTVVSNLSSIENRPVFFIVKQITNDKTVIGVLETTYLIKSQRSVVFGKRGHSMIVDSTGKVVAHPNSDWEKSSKDASKLSVVKKMMNGETGVSYFYSPPMKADMIAGHTSVPATGWGVMVPQPMEELVDRTKNIHWAIIVVSILGLSVSTFLSWFAAKHLSQPIERISRTAREITLGAVSNGITVKHKSKLVFIEVHELTVLFNKMVTELKSSNDDLQLHYKNLEKTVESRTSELITEISIRKEAEEKLKLSSLVLESAHEAIIVTDSDQIIIEVNAAYCQTMGVTKENILGKKPNFVKSDLHDRTFYSGMWQSIKNSDKWQGEIWDKHSNGNNFSKWLSITVMRNNQNEIVNYIGIFSDITEIKQAETRLKKLAFFDQLTALPNRLLLHENIKETLLEIKDKKHVAGLMFLDLDKFKIVNDTFGHACGDKLLKQVANRLKQCVRESDVVARLGGDEFTVLLKNIQSHNDIESIAELIIDNLSQPFYIDSVKVNIGVSIGICILPKDADTLQQAFKMADTAMYQAKASGKGCYRFFDMQLNQLPK